MAALQFVDHPNYAALLLRRTFADLNLSGALIDRAHSWLASTSASWSQQDKRWTFPSGSTLTFGYLENENHKYRYQSSEFQFIGFDELTQFSRSQFTYMFSRLRRLEASKIPLRVRSASNPGNVGHEFVKQRYVSPGDPARPFIAARLSDNPHLDQREYERSLEELDPETRMQLLQGVWDEPTPEGSYYGRLLEIAEGEGRVGNVPWEPGLRVDTWWDLGIASGRDSMTIWFTQTAGREIRVIDCFGDSGEGFPYYAKVLQDKHYVYGTHHAPHDIRVRELGTGKSRQEQAEALGIRFEQVAEIGFDSGVNAARSILGRCWFDKTKCATGLRALKNYRKEWDERHLCWKERPLKDWTNDYADSFRMFAVGHEDAQAGDYRVMTNLSARHYSEQYGGHQHDDVREYQVMRNLAR